MKKRIYKSLSVTVIALAMVVSFQMSKANNATDLTMENIEALAMADGESGGNVDCHLTLLRVCEGAGNGYCNLNYTTCY